MEKETEYAALISFSQLGRRELVSVQTGRKIGFADDLKLDAHTGRITALVVSGFGIPFFGRSEPVCVPWEQLKMIGQDTILVEGSFESPKPGFRTFLQQFFSGNQSSRKKDV